jgi:hypothetical protein
VALAVAGVLLAGLWLGAVVVRDVLLRHGWVYPQALALWVPAGAALAGLIAWAAGRRSLRSLGAGLVAGALLLHVGIQTGIAAYQSRVEYSTTYNYGQSGLQETAAFIRARTAEQEIISSMKDVGFLAKRRYYENYGALYDDASAARLIEAWEAGRVSYIVFTEGIGQDGLAIKPALRDWVARNADLAASFGNYRIYQPRVRKSWRDGVQPPGAGAR